MNTTGTTRTATATAKVDVTAPEPMTTRDALLHAIATLDASTWIPEREAARRLRQLIAQRGMSEFSPSDPDGLPEFIDVVIDG